MSTAQHNAENPASLSDRAGGSGDALGAEADRLFRAVRRIQRAADLGSRAVLRRTGLTLPQLVVLRAVAELGEVTTKALSERADLSSATVVTILEKLEARGLVSRYRSRADRRIVHTELTRSGHAALDAAPALMGNGFGERVAALPAGERLALVAAAERLAALIAPDPARGPLSDEDGG
jgi:DNA-binding MarR family transcriptional regulator